MRSALLLALFCLLVEADDFRYALQDLFQRFKSQLEEQHAAKFSDLASRLSASETKMAEFQSRLTESERLVGELQKHKAGCTPCTQQQQPPAAPVVNPTPQRPAPPVAGGAGGSSGSGGSGFCASRTTGLYPDPDNRNRFYQCHDGRTFQKSCDSSLVFDTGCSCCNWP